jgi:hypothetical protein
MSYLSWQVWGKDSPGTGFMSARPANFHIRMRSCQVNFAVLWTNPFSPRYMDNASLATLHPIWLPQLTCGSAKVSVDQWSYARRLWIGNISGPFSITGLHQYINFGNRLQYVNLRGNVPNKFIWKWSANQQYSASSVYYAFFYSECGLPASKELSKTRALSNCKFFMWLALLERCWTSGCLQWHNLQNSGPCALSAQWPSRRSTTFC